MSIIHWEDDIADCQVENWWYVIKRSNQIKPEQDDHQISIKILSENWWNAIRTKVREK